MKEQPLSAPPAEARLRPQLPTPEAVLGYLPAELALAPIEQLWMLLLDATNGLLGAELVRTGALDEVAFPIRKIMRQALQADAQRIILVHNHPSGDPRPSAADKAVTLRLADIARALDIELYNRLIVAAGGWTSFRAQGLL